MDTFTITIILIVSCTMLGAFINGRTRDKCLADLSGFRITLEHKDGKTVWGDLRAESTALELVYTEPYLDKKDGHLESSYILYKNEFQEISLLVRYVDQLSPASSRKRDRVLRKAVKPPFWTVGARKLRNIFGTIRDSLMEAVNLFVGRVKSITPAGKFLSGQDKYLSQMQGQVIAGLSASYEPTLERYVGRNVVLSMMRDGKKEEYSGILKDYTAEFIEILNADYKAPGSGVPAKADLVVPRSVGIIRHAGVRT